MSAAQKQDHGAGQYRNLDVSKLIQPGCFELGLLSNRTALGTVFKLVEAAQKSWRRLDGNNQLPKLILGVRFADGLEVVAKPTNRQPATAA